MMRRPLIVCNNGCSSSVLTQHLNQQIKAASLQNDVMIDSQSFYLTFPCTTSKHDIIMLCPQTYHELLMLEQRDFPDVPVYIIPPKTFVQMSLFVFLQDAEDLLVQYQKEHKNPIHFPDEDCFMSDRRSVSCYYSPIKNQKLKAIPYD